MKLIKNILDLLNEKYEKWMYIFLRLIMCFLVMNLAVYALVSFGLIICPVILLLIGDGFVGFLAWYFLPVTLFVTWVLYDISKMIYEDYIDTGLY